MQSLCVKQEEKIRERDINCEKKRLSHRTNTHTILIPSCVVPELSLATHTILTPFFLRAFTPCALRCNHTILTQGSQPSKNTG
jgi:hypothetical protein